ncbi:TetR/AcrR family transcriptional regulator [Streptomyces cathayae]|uniref:TetR/AcrR family transcriptional regulator n=1 Tax=Streptomyces cathayae TaxID=3031124 RepID=A0ABY8KDW1_9ACTN|nr:TetR/AcrR family transcriptional regulator [Streptomyces sp. HUAS 5]WGD45205.1 TetR/AcrR family transcriptional regulator [Streptomyces sp. HUAS 5]
MTEPAETTAKSRRRRWPQGYDPQGTRRALVDSSLHLFEQEGFDRTTLQQIVDGANLTKGAFYHHFQSKEDVLWQIQNEYLDTQIKAARAIVEQHSDIADQLRALIRLSLSGVASYRAHVAIFYQERRHLTGEHLRAVTEKRDELEALICGIVQHGIDAGKFRSNVTSRIVAFGIIGMCASTFQWFNPDGTMSVDDVTDQFCTLVLDGLVV